MKRKPGLGRRARRLGVKVVAVLVLFSAVPVVVLRWVNPPLTAAMLTRRQAALLAAVLPDPLELRVTRPSGYVLERRAWILRQMKQLGGVAYLHGL